MKWHAFVLEVSFLMNEISQFVPESGRSWLNGNITKIQQDVIHECTLM